MKKLLIYPFTYEHREIIMYEKNIKNYLLTGCVAINETECNILKKELTEFSIEKITYNFSAALEECDTVLFLETSNLYNPKAIYQTKIDEALKKNKEIVISRNCLHLLDLNEFDKIGLLGDTDESVNAHMQSTYTYLKEIDTPAIGIMGIGDYCNKFCCELSIGEFFKLKGYNVFQIGSKDYITLFGGMLIPSFVYDKNFSCTDRIIKLNHFIFDICEKENPDLLIIGMPGGIMPLNTKILNDFGEIPFIISNAINFDVGVLCSYFYEKVDNKYFTEYRNYCKYKLNCAANFFNISNSSCRFDLDSRERSLEYLHYERILPNNVVSETEKNEEFKLYNVLDEVSKNNLMMGIYDELTSGIRAF